MSDSFPKRRFGFGCRETPDAYNKCLERQGFYRKHIATDSSSLFRVFSELRYDIQLYHTKVRAECVKFMRSNKALFVKDIRHRFDAYVKNLARPRTYGSLVEVKVLATLYKANIILYEPYTEGKWYIFSTENKLTWRIFIGRDNHFDVVYPLEYMQDVAACQAIVYQILYSRVLRLPDVEYAVERMLHDPEDKLMKYEKNKDGTTIASTEDGLRLELATPGHSTQCVLMYSHLCHFHNHTNFPQIEQFFMEHGPEEGCRVYINDTFRHGSRKPNPLLREPTVSCVRQLLSTGITPFPYKAAKSLDTNIYRNVEYDVWQEMRMERLVQMLGADKRFHEPRYSKRTNHVNAHALNLIKKATQEVKIEPTVALSEPIEEPISASPESDTSHALAPYSMQRIYFSTPDPYTLNTIGIIPTETNHLTFADPNCASPCLCTCFPPSSTMHFHTSPLTPLQQTSPPNVQGNEMTLAGPDLIALVPHTLNHQPMQNEYVMMYDSLFQTAQQQPQAVPQQQHHFSYLHQTPPHQQQALNLYQPPPQHQEQQPQITAPFHPRCLFHCVPNGTEANNRGPLPMMYDANQFPTLPTGLWRI